MTFVVDARANVELDPIALQLFLLILVIEPSEETQRAKAGGVNREVRLNRSEGQAALADEAVEDRR